MSFLFKKDRLSQPAEGASKQPKRLWLDLGDLGDLVNPAGPHEQWQDHGMGLLRTILKNNGIETDSFSTRQCTSWDEVERRMKGFDMLIMNVRSYTFPVAYRSAKIFKKVNPKGIVLAGGMHATVALDEMTAIDFPGHFFLPCLSRDGRYRIDRFLPPPKTGQIGASTQDTVAGNEGGGRRQPSWRSYLE